MKIESYLVKEAFDAGDWDRALDILIRHFGLEDLASTIKNSEPLIIEGYWGAIFIYTRDNKYSWTAGRGLSCHQTAYQPHGGIKVVLTRSGQPKNG